MTMSLVEKRLQNAQLKVSILSQHSNELLLEPELLSSALEELTVILEELNVQYEELVQTRQELELERQRYWELFEFAPDAYIVTDTAGVIQQANQFTAGFFGIRKEFLVGKPLVVFISKAERKAFHDKLNHTAELLQHRHWQVEITPRRGEAFPAAIAVTAVYDIQRQIIGWRWLLRDLTLVPQSRTFVNTLESPQELQELRSRYIQTISHEFRTPMTVVQTSVELLQRYNEAISQETKSRCFQIINTAIQSMLRLLEQVSLYKAELSELKANLSRINVEQICETVMAKASLKESITLHQSQTAYLHSFQCNCHLREPWVYLDATMLQIILDNLLNNAIKYSPQGGEIELNLRQEDQYLILEIKDQGIGIPTEDLPKLYEPFHRAKNVVNFLPGIGFGLAIVKKIVDLLEGAIVINSQLGIGTTVTITLPLVATLPTANPD
ncbi:ATP-binding protein [Calothrix sp. UHCC 0171]|uniref:PAS domain-containing sensor histidine kinase n=1 Tax=Calothrix sp. UHCC 0171 TaxID=3110245 RepID=UPI002B1F5346|nr:ATP-binding protein [Calothrix sp. UHCC 0171]MEA5572004.1 ATP-binding protein [Calothrix sp. UHCC 0171]